MIPIRSVGARRFATPVELSSVRSPLIPLLRL